MYISDSTIYILREISKCRVYEMMLFCNLFMEQPLYVKYTKHEKQHICTIW